MGSLIRDDAWLIVAVASISIQMETSSILTLDAIDRAIGDFLVGLLAFCDLAVAIAVQLGAIQMTLFRSFFDYRVSKGF